ncbi:hypothetical protein HanHA89_Chr04g0159011 [Helianthus annuus]|nr:hypothetical protein HanHA89_Chr04g0159011 [Helianthus annuus]
MNLLPWAVQIFPSSCSSYLKQPSFPDSITFCRIYYVLQDLWVILDGLLFSPFLEVMNASTVFCLVK